MANKFLFTSEAVSEGHPDKICDQISDAILDACLENDPDSRVACECYASENFLVIGGEITTKANVNYEEVARNVIKNIGYDKDEYGFNYKNVKIVNVIKSQSPDISQGIDHGKIEDQGAGDQGIMFGYATNQTSTYMPISLDISEKLVKRATFLRKNGTFKHARPDMKSQVTMDYTDPKNPRVDTVLMSIQHDPDIDLDEFKKFIGENIIKETIKEYNLNLDYKVLINPTGIFVIGGPKGDVGLTGRKIIVDTYGGEACHGGGCFSGKDPSKVDRSAALYSRYIAKNLVAAGVADRIQIQLSYAIGVSEPVSISISTFKTAKCSDEKILEIINKLFDCRPGKIIEQFDLKHPTFKYQDISVYGCFGRDELNLPWEKLDKVEEIKKLLD